MSGEVTKGVGIADFFGYYLKREAVDEINAKHGMQKNNFTFEKQQIWNEVSEIVSQIPTKIAEPKDRSINRIVRGIMEGSSVIGKWNPEQITHNIWELEIKLQECYAILNGFPQVVEFELGARSQNDPRIPDGPTWTLKYVLDSVSAAKSAMLAAAERGEIPGQTYWTDVVVIRGCQMVWQDVTGQIPPKWVDRDTTRETLSEFEIFAQSIFNKFKISDDNKNYGIRGSVGSALRALQRLTSQVEKHKNLGHFME